MLGKSLTTLIALLFCMAFLSDYAGARPSPEAGAPRPGSRIATGASHTCVIEEDATVSCWGGNSNGQLGDGTTTQRLTPVTVLNLSNVVAITAGQNHTCALTANGAVRCWGDNLNGKLGDGTTTNRLIPVPVSGLTNAVAISAGTGHTCAVTGTGVARCWGLNKAGQLGDGSQTDRLTPNFVSGNQSGDVYIAVSAGDSHTCALDTDAQVRCWGLNNLGQIGDGTTNNRSLPQQTLLAPANFNRVVALQAGQNHTCALIDDGTARCWGGNSSGQLGNGTTNNSLLPVTVSGLVRAGALSAGARSSHTCALLVDGTSQCWGSNSFGQLGDGTTSNSSTPGAVSGLTNAVELATSLGHSCAMLADGSARCWARNISGQLGDGTVTNRLAPVPVSGLSASIAGRGVSAGGNHTCARRANGVAVCWGSNIRGQLGDGTTTSKPEPTQVQGINNVTQISAGSTYSCARLAGGTVRCWGDNDNGQLGIGSLVNQSLPAEVVGLNDALSVTTGSGNHTCALRATGSISCWGFNSSGQLGNGNTTFSTTPVSVNGLTEHAVAVSAGGSSTCALEAQGGVVCWGNNGAGQLGNGTTTSSFTPVRVIGTFDVVAISTGNNHACALRRDGIIHCWGANGGRLGNGSNAASSVPVQVSGIANAIAISAGGADHTCAVLRDGTARCWGGNSNGKLGDGTTTLRTTPVIVSNLTNAVQISAGGNHTCAMRADGQPFCWGFNSSGQVGDGTTTSRSFPTLVPSFTFNIHPEVIVKRDGKKAQVFALANCEAGARARIHLELRQGSNVGQGQATVECTGALERYPIEFTAHGRDRFTTGAAVASAVAEVKDHGTVIDVQEWTRSVTISVAEFLND